MFTCLPFRGRRWHAWLTLPPRWLCLLFQDILRITETNANSCVCVCESALYATGQSRDMFLNISKWWDDKTCTKLWGKVCSQLSVPTLGINQSAPSPPDGSCPPGPGNDAIRTERLEKGDTVKSGIKKKISWNWCKLLATQQMTTACVCGVGPCKGDMYGRNSSQRGPLALP